MRKEEVAQEHVSNVSLPVRQTEHPNELRATPCRPQSLAYMGTTGINGIGSMGPSSGETFQFLLQNSCHNLPGFLISHYSFLEDAFSLFHQPPLECGA